MNAALLLIDLQIDFLADHGRMPVGTAHADGVIMTANRMIALFRERDWPIIAVYNQFRKTDVMANYFRNNAALEGSEGGNIDPRIQDHDGPLFAKARSSAFSNPDFSAYLKERDIGHVVMCGVYAEGCVRATAFDARRAGLHTTVIADGVASNRAYKLRWALSHMQKRGIHILSCEEYLKSGAVMPEEPMPGC